MSIKEISIIRKITFLLFMSFFLIGIITFRDYGISIDEEFQRSSGFYWLYYVLNFLNFEELKELSLFKLNEIKGFTLSDVTTNQYYGVIFDLPVAFFEAIFKINDPQNYFYFKHFLNFTIFFIGSIFFYKILLNRFKNYKVALIGTLFFILSPRIYGNSFYNPKDIIFLSLLSVAFYFCFKLLDKITYKNFLIFAIFTALASSQRMYGVFLPLSFIAFYFLSALSNKKDLNYLPGIIFFCISFFIFFVIFWPYLWSAPIENFFIAYKYFSHHDLLEYIKILFNGEYIKANYVPYTYIFTWIIITIPTIYTILFIIGYFQILKRFFLKFIKIENNNIYYDLWRSKNEKKDLFILFNFTCIIFYLIAFNISMFTGWRHLYFLNIFIIYISTYSFYKMNFYFKSNIKNKILLLFIIFYLIFISYKMFVYHPYQNIYFNSFFNKVVKNVHQKFEVDYWGLTGRKFLKDILVLEKNKNSIVVATGSYLPLERSLKMISIKDRKKIIIVGQDYEKADYIYNNFVFEVDIKDNDKYKIPSNFSKINQFILDDIVVYEVYKKVN
jgi:hypothetical protein